MQNDIIINGAGLVGLSLAIALAQNDFNVTVVEAGALDLNWQPSRPSALRVSAINHATQKFLDSIGVWQAIEKMRLAPYQHMTVWDAGGDQSLEFHAADLAQAYLGYMIENEVMQAALHKQAAELPNLAVISEQKASHIVIESEQASLTLQSGQTLNAKLLVAADGAHSWLRQQAQIECREKDYGQSAIVATIRTEQPHQETAWQRFLPTGPLAFLPLGEPHLCSIVWSCRHEMAKQLLNLSPQAFAVQLQTAFDNRLGALKLESELAKFPLIRRHAETYVKPRIALVGDSAHTIHPLAGQGVNLGFADSQQLAATLIQRQQQGRDIGLLQNLRRYARSRRAPVTEMLLAMDAFHHVFTSQNPSVMLLRNFGFGQVNRRGNLKNLFVRHAIGI